jgi:SAM-dependent methyltransferase
MNGGTRFTENIPQLAETAARLASRFCDGCQNYHFLWPYLRLIGTPGGVGDSQRFLESAFAETSVSDRRRVLVAGCADTGLLSQVARATEGRGAELAVLDRCRTPLELCRDFADRWMLPLETLHVDLLDLSIDGRFDVVLAHTILSFIVPDRRLEAMIRLRRALRPGGKLILRFRTRGDVQAAHLSIYRKTVPSRLIEQLESMHLPLPEPRDALQRRVEAYAAERHAREVSEAEYAEVEKLLDGAGFDIGAIAPVASGHSTSFEQSSAALSSRLFVVTATAR